MFSRRRGFSDAERERLAAMHRRDLRRLRGQGGSGRQRPVAEIEEVARGRVWTGSDAREVGLVDELGGMRDAVRIARTRGGLPEHAPVVRALHVPPLARLTRPKNSEDPRALTVASLPDLADLAAALGLSLDKALAMPSIQVR